MKNLDRALELSKAPVTLDDFLEWDRLLLQSHGEEAEAIGELYTSMMSNAVDGAYDQYVERCMESEQ